MIGIEDEFGQSGTKEELFEVYKLNEKAIIEKATPQIRGWSMKNRSFSK